MSDIKIVEIRAHAITSALGDKSGSVDPAAPRLCTPTRIFPDAGERAMDYQGPVAVVVVEVVTDSGIVGVGTAGAGNAGTYGIVKHQFAPLLIGADPFQVELLWAKMYRTSARYGRRGSAISALSAIDIALWDIKGQALGVPVYELLGGAVRNSIPAYASRLYARTDLHELADEARGYRDAGFTMMKQRFGFGPIDGRAGMKANLKLIETVRDAVGEDVEIAADAYMGWDLSYAIEMERMLRPCGLKWIEEPLMPHDLAAYAKLCRVSETAISHGEHSYTRWDFIEILDHGAADILQPDVNRVGGLTEARKISAIASARDVPLVPHSNELHNLHLVVSQWGSPFAEYFPNRGLDNNTLFYELFDGNPEPVDGAFTLEPRPGIGYSLKAEAVERLKVSV